MADTIYEHFTTEFSANWIHRAQQTRSKLDAFVVDENFSGERKRYDRMGALTSRRKTERKAPTTATNPTLDSRWAYREGYELTNLLDELDAQNLGTLVLPDSDLVKAHAAAFARDKDDVAVAVALGSVKTGTLGTDTYAFQSGQQIAAGGTGLTLPKLLTANEILEGADIDDIDGSGDATRVMVVSAQQMTNLLNTTEVKSSDYNTVKALVNGQVDTFLGFRFVRVSRLPKASTTRTCVCWVKGAIKRTVGDRSTRISIRDDLSGATQIRSTWDLGGTRVCDEAVVQIDCTES